MLLVCKDETLNLLIHASNGSSQPYERVVSLLGCWFCPRDKISVNMFDKTLVTQ